MESLFGILFWATAVVYALVVASQLYGHVFRKPKYVRVAPYALAARHKHIPEMTLHCGLEREPQFIPAIGPFACGLRVEIPLHASLMAARSSAKTVWEALHERYRSERFVDVRPMLPARNTDEFALDPRARNDTNCMDLHVIGHEDGHVLLVAILDNLGKGAAGVAIQNLNLMLGLPEDRGLPV